VYKVEKHPDDIFPCRAYVKKTVVDPLNGVAGIKNITIVFFLVLAVVMLIVAVVLMMTGRITGISFLAPAPVQQQSTVYPTGQQPQMVMHQMA
jgi:hypothetical protein